MRPRTPSWDGIAIACRTESAEKCTPISGVVVCARAGAAHASAKSTAHSRLGNRGINLSSCSRRVRPAEARSILRLPVELGVGLALAPRMVVERIADALDERRVGVDERLEEW